MAAGPEIEILYHAQHEGGKTSGKVYSDYSISGQACSVILITLVKADDLR